jgi:hypothetical protein
LTKAINTDESSDSSENSSNFEDDFEEPPSIDNTLQARIEMINRGKEVSSIKIPQRNRKVLVYDSKAKIMKYGIEV